MQLSRLLLFSLAVVVTGEKIEDLDSGKVEEIKAPSSADEEVIDENHPHAHLYDFSLNDLPDNLNNPKHPHHDLRHHTNGKLRHVEDYPGANAHIISHGHDEHEDHEHERLKHEILHDALVHEHGARKQKEFREGWLKTVHEPVPDADMGEHLQTHLKRKGLLCEGCSNREALKKMKNHKNKLQHHRELDRLEAELERLWDERQHRHCITALSFSACLLAAMMWFFGEPPQPSREAMERAKNHLD